MRVYSCVYIYLYVYICSIYTMYILNVMHMEGSMRKVSSSRRVHPAPPPVVYIVPRATGITRLGFCINAQYIHLCIYTTYDPHLHLYMYINTYIEIGFIMILIMINNTFLLQAKKDLIYFKVCIIDGQSQDFKVFFQNPSGVFIEISWQIKYGHQNHVTSTFF